MKFALLDHGHLNLIETWGSDEAIVRAARQSTNKGFLGWGHNWKCSLCERAVGDYDVFADVPSCISPDGSLNNAHDWRPVAGDEKLLRTLYENRHSTPFEMAGMTLEVRAPIFVFREWHRHRTQSYSEMSARYTPLPDLNYMPTVDRLLNVGTGNAPRNTQQAAIKGAPELTREQAAEFLERTAVLDLLIEEHYQWALAIGVPKELARIRLPVGRYSQMWASGNLRNWLSFLTLRSAPNAQYEIRVYADAVAEVIKEKFPRTYEIFVDGPRADAERAITNLSDSAALNMQNTYGDLLRLLAKEARPQEGAVHVLKRLIQDLEDEFGWS